MGFRVYRVVLSSRTSVIVRDSGGEGITGRHPDPGSRVGIRDTVEGQALIAFLARIASC
jgi:hypothetical protein